LETIIFACISLVFLIPIIYFLPLGIAFRGKLIITGAAMIAAVAGLVANFTYTPWLGALLSFLLLVIFTYLFEKKTEIFAFVGKEQVNEDFSYTYSDDSTLNGKDPEPVGNFNEQDDQENEQLFRESIAESNEEIADFESEIDLDHIIFEEKVHIDSQEDIVTEPLLGLGKEINESPEVAVVTLSSEEFDFFQNKLDVEDEDNQPVPEAEEVEEWDEDLFVEVLELAGDKEVLIEEGSLLTDPTVSIVPEVVEEWDDDLFLEVLEPEEATVEVVEEDHLIEISSPVEELLVEEAAPVVGEPDESVSLAELLDSEDLIEVADVAITDDGIVNEDLLEENVYVEMATRSEAAASLDEHSEWLGQTVVEEIAESHEQVESTEQEIEVMAESTLEAPVMTDIDNSDDQVESVQEERQPEQLPVHKTKLQQEVFQTLIEELTLAKKQRNDSDYEQLVSSYLDESLQHQDYYTFATMLIQQYVQTKNQEKLQQLLVNLENKFQAYPVVLAEISYLKNRFCKRS